MMAIPRVIPALFAIWSASARVELRGLQPLPLDALLEEEAVVASPALPLPTYSTDLTDAECVDKPFPLEWQKYVKDCADVKAKGNCNRPGGYVPYARAYCPKTCGYCDATCADQPIPQTFAQYGPDCASAKAKGTCEAHPEYARVYCPVTCGMCHGEDAPTEADDVFFAFDSDSDMIDEDSDMIDEVEGLFAADLEAPPRCAVERAACGWWQHRLHHCCHPMRCVRHDRHHPYLGNCGYYHPHRPTLGDADLPEGEGDAYLYEGEGADVENEDEMEVPYGEDEQIDMFL